MRHTKDDAHFQISWSGSRLKAGKSRNPPVVLNPEAAAAFMTDRKPPSRLVRPMLGAGLRLREALGLRVPDRDLERREPLVSNGMGETDRMTVLPERLYPSTHSKTVLSQTSFAPPAPIIHLPSGLKMVARDGFEPPTRGSSIHCSTN